MAIITLPENAEDITEHALNFGRDCTMDRYKASSEVVFACVANFVGTVSEPCSCDQERAKGHAMMCFVCTGRKMSISLKERLLKAGFSTLT